MKNFKFSKASSLTNYSYDNIYDEKFGDDLVTVSDLSQLQSSEAKFVMFGVPDIQHSKDKFSLKPIELESLLKDLINIENNKFNNAKNLIVLGEIDLEAIEITDLREKPEDKKIEEVYKTLENIISELTTAISQADKIPIMLGGSFKNSMDITKEIKSAKAIPISVLDFSPNSSFDYYLNVDKSDNLRPEIFNKYYAFGLHKNYTSKRSHDMMTTSKQMEFQFYEDCLHLTTLDKCVKFKNAIDFLNSNIGFILNFKSIQDLSSSCESSSGFSVRDIRTFMKVIRKEKVVFFHISGFESCDGNKISGILSYIISDFIRENNY